MLDVFADRLGRGQVRRVAVAMPRVMAICAIIWRWIHRFRARRQTRHSLAGRQRH
jgi:hypothetical protein